MAQRISTRLSTPKTLDNNSTVKTEKTLANPLTLKAFNFARFSDAKQDVCTKIVANMNGFVFVFLYSYVIVHKMSALIVPQLAGGLLW